MGMLFVMIIGIGIIAAIVKGDDTREQRRIREWLDRHGYL